MWNIKTIRLTLLLIIYVWVFTDRIPSAAYQFIFYARIWEFVSMGWRILWKEKVQIVPILGSCIMVVYLLNFPPGILDSKTSGKPLAIVLPRLVLQTVGLKYLFNENSSLTYTLKNVKSSKTRHILHIHFLQNSDDSPNALLATTDN